MRASRSAKFSRQKSNPKPANHKHGLRSKSAKNTETLAADANELSPFLNLPMELKIQVAKHLAVGDLINLRLMSKQWAASGASSLFPHGFSLRPHRDDMTRLEAVSQHEELVKGIDHLEIYVGDMDPDQFGAAIKRDGYLTRKKTSELLLAIYSPEQLAKHCSPEMLARLLPTLGVLKSISISSVRYPFWDIDAPLNEAWDGMQEECDDFEMTHCYTSAVSRRRYAGILSAMAKSKAVINTLELDLMPIDCFLSSARVEFGVEIQEVFTDLQRRMYQQLNNIPSSPIVTLDADLKHVLSHVTTLSMGWVGSGYSELEYTDLDHARRLSSFLGAFKNLISLDLKYGVEEDQTDEFMDAWQNSFFQLKYPHLERLRLKEFQSTESQLLPFLLKHSSTLKYLQLESFDFEVEEDRTTKDFLTDLREKLNLEKFEYLDESDRIYDGNWEPIKYPTNIRQMVTDTKLIDYYVTKKCPWPMADDEPRPRGWKRKFAGSDLSFLDLSEAEMADLLADDWETEGDSDSDSDDSDDDMDDFDDDDDDDDMDEDDDMSEDGHGGFFLPMTMLMHMGMVGDHLPHGFTWQHRDEVGGGAEEEEEGDDDEEMPELVD